MVYGLRYYFRHIGENKRAINLPSLKKKATLPVILNRSELKELFRAPKLLKHRIWFYNQTITPPAIPHPGRKCLEKALGGLL
jgi:hypothetical protein